MHTRSFSRFLLICFLLLTGMVHAQNSYRYTLDLNKVVADRLQVELLTPKVQSATAVFAFPKIIPGTYSISDYGKFISGMQAFDKNGKALPVKRLNDNQWRIARASSLHKITYTAEDIFDTEKSHEVYPMAATNFEEGKNFVLHSPGIFGFIDGMNKTPFDITIHKPDSFYGATALIPVKATSTQDVFQVRNLDELYDAPIMYSRPDTTTVQVGNAEVLVSVYSPNGRLRSKEIAGWMRELLYATKDYLGGKLPTNRYAFLYYFHEPRARHSFPPGLGGALEHASSSFYYVPEGDPSETKGMLVDISSHEFFHIITPLTIASREVKEFNFSRPVLSKHLWLYEGVTEYTSHHVQVKYGLNTVQEFLNKLSQKITNSRSEFDDDLSFTELSKESAGKYKDQYGNVYEKGALIAAMLDIYLLHLSDGHYGLRHLTHDLGVRYGKDRYFEDDALFDEIGRLTYPEIKAFLVRHVEKGEPIPYEDYFKLAGVMFLPKSETKVPSFGGFFPTINEADKWVISEQSKFNELGKQLGYKVGDELYAFNGVPVTPYTGWNVIDSLKQILKEGDRLEVKVGRVNSAGRIDTLTLSGNIILITITESNKLALMPNPTKKQALVRKAWLTTPAAETKEYVASFADVATVEAIIESMYDVISGPAGTRNWDRFHSLFLPGAQMGTVAATASGEAALRSFAPADYQNNNAPFFMQRGFYEEELGRQVAQYGNLAHVQSAYQFRFTPGGKVEQRGVNFITLVKSAGRWWIAGLHWQKESNDAPIPQNWLKQ